jgi:hypothetical protein
MVTGLEIVGTLAATSQLIETISKLINAISELRESIRDGPKRFRGFREELIALNDTVRHLRYGTGFGQQAMQLITILKSIAVTIDDLNRLLNKCLVVPQSSFSKALWAIRTRETGRRLLKTFSDLERKKTTLILTIQIMSSTTPSGGKVPSQRILSSGTVSEEAKTSAEVVCCLEGASYTGTVACLTETKSQQPAQAQKKPRSSQIPEEVRVQVPTAIRRVVFLSQSRGSSHSS